MPSIKIIVVYFPPLDLALAAAKRERWRGSNGMRDNYNMDAEEARELAFNRNKRDAAVIRGLWIIVLGKSHLVVASDAVRATEWLHLFSQACVPFVLFRRVWWPLLNSVGRLK